MLSRSLRDEPAGEGWRARLLLTVLAALASALVLTMLPLDAQAATRCTDAWGHHDLVRKVSPRDIKPDADLLRVIVKVESGFEA
jgi:hypothetical protein